MGKRFARSGLVLLAYLVLIAIIVPLLAKNQVSQAADSASITKSTSAEFAKGTNQNVSTTGDQIKIATGTAANWYNASWGYRQKVTIDHTKVVGADQTNFPMLVQIAAADNGVFTNAKDDGTDILFTSSTGVDKLSHEIDTFSKSTPILNAWVKIPTLSASTDTVIYIYYGNAGAADQQNKTDVWTNSFKNAWHLNSTSWTDSSSSAYNGTTAGTVTNPAGKFGTAAGFDGTGGNIIIGNKYTTGALPITIDAWVNMAASNSAIFSSNDGGLYEGVWAVLGGSGKLGMSFGDGAGSTSANRRSKDAATAMDLNQWKKVTFIYRGATDMSMYINGVDAGGSYGGTGGAIAFINNVNYPARIGNRASSGLWPTNGKIDELRYSTTGRDSNWIQTEFANQDSPSTFFSLGPESTSSEYYASTDSFWYNNSWTNRQKVTIDHTKVSTSDQTNFPILVKITDATNKVFSTAQADGDDILFASTNGAKLAHEIEKFDTTNKELDAWVKIPTLSSSADTVIYMYYGNASATSQQDKTNLWSDYNHGVWHFPESSGTTTADSSSNANTGNLTNTPTREAGKIGGAMAFVGSSSQSVLTTKNVNLGSGDNTASAWVKFTSTNNFQTIMGTFTYSAGNGSRFGLAANIQNEGAGRLGVWYQSPDYGWDYKPSSSSNYNDGSWHYVTSVKTNGNIKVYVDGAQAANYDHATPGELNLGLPVMIGALNNDGSASNFYTGSVDEARLESGIARSVSWIATEYANQNSPSTFASVGSQEYNSSYMSPSSTSAGSGIIDLGWFDGWDQTNSFTSGVTIPANTSIQYYLRSSAVGGSNESDWTSWSSLGTATSTGTFAVAKESMPSIPSATNRYLQIKIQLSSTDGVNTPTLSNYSLFYLSDTTAPTNPTTISANIGGTSITNGTWINTVGDVNFIFSGASDTDSGVAGYYLYFGTSSSADPAAVGTYQAHSGAISDNQFLTKTLTNADDGKDQYLLVKTKDAAGNVSASAQLFQLGLDITNPNQPSFVSVSPEGYTTANSFDFAWPAATDPNGSNGASGIKYYQYKRGGDLVWSHTASGADRAANDLEAYQEGANVFLVRTVDNAGNTSTNSTQVTYYWSGTAPAKPDNLSVTPNPATENNLTISWDKPTVGAGDPPIVGYWYSINAAPTLSNIVYVASTSDHVSIGPDHFASKQGENTVYVLSQNEAGNKSFESAYVASADFNCQTSAPPIPASVSVYDSSDRSLDRWMLTVQWQAGTGGNPPTFDHYSIERSTDNISFTQIATTTSAAYIDASGLNNTTTYYYRIKAVDNAGSDSVASSVVSKTPTGKYTLPPNYLAQPTSSAKSTTATIHWVTDRDSTSFVRYGTIPGVFDESKGQLEAVKNHTVELTGLNAGMTYYFQSQSVDEDRDYSTDSAYSATQTFQTLSAPAISNVSVSNITLNSADIGWETTTVATSNLNYGRSSAYGTTVDDQSATSSTKHQTKITGLQDSTSYHFKIAAVDVDGIELTSDDYSFETLPYPKVSNLKIEILSDKTYQGAKLTWETNVATSSTAKYGIGSEEKKESSKAKLEKSHEITVENLTDSSNYTFIASGRDQFGNECNSSSQTVITPPDKRPPTISNISIETSNVGLGNQDKSQITVSWDTDEPATSQVEYNAGISGADYQKKTVDDKTLTTKHMVIISDLEPNKPYHARVVSADKNNNISSSDDQTFISGDVPKSALQTILGSLTKTFSFIQNIF